MARELSDELIKEWQILMTGFKQISLSIPSWNVIVKDSKEIEINKKWLIICHFINFEYIEVNLSFKGDEVMKLKHISSYRITTSTVLEFINQNRDLN